MSGGLPPLLEPGEAGFAGQPVLLSGTDDLGRAVSLSATTDADGNFSFAGLRSGTYTLTQPSQPPNPPFRLGPRRYQQIAARLWCGFCSSMRPARKSLPMRSAWKWARP